MRKLTSLFIFFISIQATGQGVTQIVHFRNYFSAAHAAYSGHDEILKACLNAKVDYCGIDTLIKQRGTMSGKEFYEAALDVYRDDKFTNNFRVRDLDAFTDTVLSIAKALGYTQQTIPGLSIHNLVLLAGKITAKRMWYDFDYSIEKNFNEYSVLYADELFLKKKKGVCIQFTFVNIAVFEVLKKINFFAKGTYMCCFVESDHAFNKVVSITESGFMVTYVDPTQLSDFIHGYEDTLDNREKSALVKLASNSSSLTQEERTFAKEVKGLEEMSYSTDIQIKHNPWLIDVLQKHAAVVY